MSLLSLSPSPFSSSPLHGFRLPKSSSGRSGGCGEADWTAFFMPMTDEAEGETEQGRAEEASSRQQQQQQQHSRQQLTAAVASSPPFLSGLDSPSPPQLSPGSKALFSPLESLQPSPLFVSLSPHRLCPASSLTASLSSRRQEASLSARRADAAVAASSASLAAPASTSCPTAFTPPAATAPATASLSSAAASRCGAVAEAQRSRDPAGASSRGLASAAAAASSLPSPSSLSSSQSSSSSLHCALSDMSNDHYLTFEVLSLDSMTGCIASEEHPFAPSTSAVFDFVSLHAPLQDAANAVSVAAGVKAAASSSSSLLQLCDSEASGELCSSRPTTPSTPRDTDAEDEGDEQHQQQLLQQRELRQLSPATSAFYFSSSSETQPTHSHREHPSSTSGLDSYPYAAEHRRQRLEAALAATPSRAGGDDWRQPRCEQFAQQQRQHKAAASPAASFASCAPPLAAGGDGMETECELSCADLDALVCSDSASGRMDEDAPAAGSRISELHLARSRTAVDALDSTVRLRQQQQQSQSQPQRRQQQRVLSRQPMSPRSFRRFSFPALRPVSCATASSCSSSASSSLFPPPLSPSSRTSSASSPLPRSLGSEEESSSSGSSSGLSSLLPTPSHSPLPVMAASITPASVMAHQITPVTAHRVLPAAATVTAAAAVPELRVTARAIPSSQQQQQQQQQQQHVLAAMPHQSSPTPATAVSSPNTSVKAVGSVSVGTVIAEAALASIASVSSPVMAAVPSTAPQMATATFSAAAAAASSAANAGSPVVPAHSVAVVPAAASLPSLPLPQLPASSSPVHRARVVGSGSLHPRQAFTLPQSKKLKTARHSLPPHQQAMQATAAAAAASAGPLLAASCVSLHPPAAPVPANALDGRYWKGSSR